MSFDILPQTSDDAPEVFTASGKAFTRFNRILFNSFPLSKESTEILSEHRIKSFSKTPHAQNFKAVDRKTGAIIGAARWVIHAEEEKLDKTVEEEAKGAVEAIRVPELREESASAFYKGLFEGKREVIGIKEEDGKVTKLKPRVDLDSLFTHPDYQGKGVGKALLQRCIQDAEELGLVTYLEATEEGLPLYAKYGFESIRTYVFDAEQFGIEGAQQYTYMIRPCKATE